ncbi:hypothetical protein GLAREA_01586 [Glarea lozoyensis ATCC 20868]|uniref:Uncharacterized protein n=1 Tax=Glarea lozoyensis (strain ATCC 20868 / MF5171) TaxID=1116229 RepID=S3CKD2_GLAL2|nr:uncharacterized protein GLAREA_01586 [Glarea lozoyensis ATCC 20868]EPE25674.1 hypothetical protein GLAREA_01586 [Glarea lozoyensis ATCC 20868]
MKPCSLFLVPLEQSPNHHSLLDSVVERRISYTRREETEPRIKHGYSITKRPANRRKTPTSSSIDHLKRTKPDPVTSISTLLQNCSENTSPRLQAWTTVPNPAPATSGQFFTDGTNTDRSEQRRRDVGQTHNGGSPYRFSSIIEIAPSHGGLHKSENGRQGPSTFVG